MQSSLRVHDAIETVSRALGLREGEAAIYVHLCLGGPAKAGDLAGSLRLHRNEVYRNATRLLSRGLIELTLERPARYAAVSPATVFDAEISTRLASVDELRLARDSVFPLLSQVHATADAPMRSTYKVVQGREEIYALRDRLIEAARESVDWATTFPPSVVLAERSGTLDLLARRVRGEGIALRAVLLATKAGAAKLEIFRGLEGASVRTPAMGNTVQFLVIDGSELLMWVVNDPSESLHARDEVAIHTTAPGFVEAEALLFEQTWASAQLLIGEGA